MHAVCLDYFENFLPRLMHQKIVANLEHLTVCFEIDVVDSHTGKRGIRIDRGAMTAILSQDYTPAATFVLDAETFGKLIAGTRSPIDAFLAQELEIRGDMEQALALGPILEAFFRLCPYEP